MGKGVLILTGILIIGIIFVSGCTTGSRVPSTGGIEHYFHDVYLSISGTPYLNNPVNLTLTVVTSNGSGRGNATLTILLPQGFELISGNLSENVTLGINEIYNHTVIVKAVETGNFAIIGWAGPYFYPRYDVANIYVLDVSEETAKVTYEYPVCTGNIFDIRECMGRRSITRP